MNVATAYLTFAARGDKEAEAALDRIKEKTAALNREGRGEAGPAPGPAPAPSPTPAPAPGPTPTPTPGPAPTPPTPPTPTPPVPTPPTPGPAPTPKPGPTADTFKDLQSQFQGILEQITSASHRSIGGLVSKLATTILTNFKNIAGGPGIPSAFESLTSSVVGIGQALGKLFAGSVSGGGMLGAIGQALQTIGPLLLRVLLNPWVLIGAAITAVGVGLLALAAPVERLRQGFADVTGSMEKARELLSSLNKTFIGTEVNMDSARRIAKDWAAQGMKNEAIVKHMRELGNISVATGASMEGMANALERMELTGKVGTRLMQMKPIMDELKKLYPKLQDEEKFMTAVHEGQFKIEHIHYAMESLGGPGGKYGDVLGNQQRDSMGWMAMIGKQIGDYFTNLGAELSKALNIPGWLGSVSELLGALGAVANLVLTVLAPILQIVGQAFQLIWKVIGGVVGILAHAITQLSIFVQWLGWGNAEESKKAKNVQDFDVEEKRKAMEEAKAAAGGKASQLTPEEAAQQTLRLRMWRGTSTHDEAMRQSPGYARVYKSKVEEFKQAPVEDTKIKARGAARQNEEAYYGALEKAVDASDKIPQSLKDSINRMEKWKEGKSPGWMTSLGLRYGSRMGANPDRMKALESAYEKYVKPPELGAGKGEYAFTGVTAAAEKMQHEADRLNMEKARTDAAVASNEVMQQFGQCIQNGKLLVYVPIEGGVAVPRMAQLTR